MRLQAPGPATLPPVRAVIPPVPQSPGRLAPGSLLAGRYRIVRLLASGSMGAVYQVQDARLNDRPRAVKELLQNWGTQEERAEAVSWFRREGETLMGLQHPAIPLVHDTFSEGQRHYLVMDFVEGRSLEEVLLDEGHPGLPEERVAGWAEQVLDVLSYLHGRPDPLIFRDLKPANLMLTPGGHIRLIDFGIARVFTQQAQGTAIGTPGYAPPEQYQGLAEPASDLYALGATMHHLLTGRDPRKNRPFDFPPVRSLAPEISQPVALAIDRSLAVDPRARPGTAGDMRRLLRGTSPLDGAAKLAISGTLARSSTGSGVMPVPSSRQGVPATVDPNAGAPVMAGPRDLRLRPQSMEIAMSGLVTLTRLERRTIRIRNRTNNRLLCSFDADVPWLQPDRPAAWLEPYGKLALSVNVNWANAPRGLHHGQIRVHGGGQTWSTPVQLQVRGAEALAAPGLMRSLSGLATACLVVGISVMVADAVGASILTNDTAWHLIVLGLVGRVLLGVLRAARGHYRSSDK
jgi:serine/threonine protein kinase